MSKNTSLKSAAETVCNDIGLTARLEQIQAERERLAQHAVAEGERLKTEAAALYEKLRPLGELQDRHQNLAAKVQSLRACRTDLERVAAEIEERLQTHFQSARLDAGFLASLHEWFGARLNAPHFLPRIIAELDAREKELATVESGIKDFKREHGVA